MSHYGPQWPTMAHYDPQWLKVFIPCPTMNQNLESYFTMTQNKVLELLFS